jgi:hypothetical protein
MLRHDRSVAIDPTKPGQKPPRQFAMPSKWLFGFRVHRPHRAAANPRAPLASAAIRRRFLPQFFAPQFFAPQFFVPQFLVPPRVALSSRPT